MVLFEIAVFMCSTMQAFFNMLSSVEIESGISLLDITTAIYFMTVVVGFYNDIVAFKHNKRGK